MTTKTDRVLYPVLAAVVMIGLVLTLALASAGCSTAAPRTQTVYERVEVPVPVWTPPEHIAPLPDPPRLRMDDLTGDEPYGVILTAVGRDYLTLLIDNANLRHLYSKLVALVTVTDHPPPHPTADPE
jgi:hypothetical protein